MLGLHVRLKEDGRADPAATVTYDLQLLNKRWVRRVDVLKDALKTSRSACEIHRCSVAMKNGGALLMRRLTNKVSGAGARQG